ncbi:hypothetical protein OROGR_000458 [Orobanche gracilis]
MLQSGGNLGGLTPVSTLSNKKRKAELRAFEGVHMVAAPETTIGRNIIITLSNKDREGIQCPKSDALVIFANVLGKIVDHILVDTGSFCNIIYKTALDQLGNLAKFIKTFDTALRGFGDNTVLAYGRIKLPVELIYCHDPEVRTTRNLEFVIIDVPSVYNGFLGRPFLETFECIAFSFFYCIKFPTDKGAIGTVRGNQLMAKKCLNYSCVVHSPISRSERACNTASVDVPMEINEPSNSLQPSLSGALSGRTAEDIEPRIGFESSLDLDPRIESADHRRRDVTAPIEELEKVPLDLARPELEVQVGATAPSDIKGKLIELLRKNTGNFAWSHQDMVGISPEHACHHLKIDPTRKPVHQKRRKFGPEKYAAIDEEVKKLLDNRLIERARNEAVLRSVKSMHNLHERGMSRHVTRHIK